MTFLSVVFSIDGAQAKSSHAYLPGLAVALALLCVGPLLLFLGEMPLRKGTVLHARTRHR